MSVCSIEEAIGEIRKGRMVIMMDEEDRENEGDLVMAAEMCSPEAINFMAKYGRGLICVPVTRDKARQLGLSLMVTENTSSNTTAFTVSIDGKDGVSTGISAFDRHRTIQLMVGDDTRGEDFARPGHIFPLIARDGGVLVRAGQTEGSVDLARLAGLKPMAVICEVMNEDGMMARQIDLERFGKEHGIKLCTVKDLIEYRMLNERLVRKQVETRLPTEFGEFDLMAYENVIDGAVHLALVKGPIHRDDPTLVRVHSQCLTGDCFSSLRCDCGPQLQRALQMIHEVGKGVLLYLNQEGRGIGLLNKLKAYSLQDKGKDTVEANKLLGFKPDLREYGTGAQILHDIGVGKMRLMTNNPKKIVGLEGYGLTIEERVPIEVESNSRNVRYLRTKKEKLGHLLSL
ncbi:MAG: bifunctional 3,4-dihydroxy-2-butanone-4-phosphate synthase/GTP cyclohydrolase II [Nitrospirae bacterium]|nr:bifunctional 3,4-dihydroxy-2-butanone-4-phosphate synthase/GTP cyclohydrolase II [Nitrospirota bacterium]